MPLVGNRKLRQRSKAICSSPTKPTLTTSPHLPCVLYAHMTAAPSSSTHGGAATQIIPNFRKSPKSTSQPKPYIRNPKPTQQGTKPSPTTTIRRTEHQGGGYGFK
uniref:Uncharacterized protein n=1 Tax=Opuntia streptacantha TaxID=393608 RepID=A0A7C8ZPF3_OPUST